LSPVRRIGCRYKLIDHSSQLLTFKLNSGSRRARERLIAWRFD